MTAVIFDGNIQILSKDLLEIAEAIEYFSYGKFTAESILKSKVTN